MRGLAGDHTVVPADPQYALHDTDGFRFIFENRPLLNVRLKIGADGMLPRGLLANIADLRQRLADADALFIRDGPGLLQREDAGKAPKPIITGTKRDPSSLVQNTTSIGASVAICRSLSVRTTSSAASTP